MVLGQEAPAHLVSGQFSGGTITVATRAHTAPIRSTPWTAISGTCRWPGPATSWPRWPTTEGRSSAGAGGMRRPSAAPSRCP